MTRNHNKLVSPKDVVPASLAFAAGTLTYFVVRSNKKAKHAKEMESLAMIDTLTGLHTRRALEDEYNRVASRLNRSGGNAALVLLDIDHFKRVNDTMGHAGGDKVLKDVSKLLMNTTRLTDVVARWGGEEDAILMEDTDIEGAMAATEGIRQTIESETSVTASFGVVEVDPRKNLYGNIAKADMALYQAKNLGRNRVVRYEDTLPPRPTP